MGFIAFNGGTRHFYYLSQEPKKALFVVKYNWIAQPFGIMSLALGKIAIAALLLRLVQRTSKWRRWVLYGISAWTLVNGILMSVFTFVQCEDPRALWDPVIKAKTKCWNPASQSDFSIYGSSKCSESILSLFRSNSICPGAFTLVDFVLAALPITLVWKLKLDIKRKVALGLLLGCGSL